MPFYAFHLIFHTFELISFIKFIGNMIKTNFMSHSVIPLKEIFYGECQVLSLYGSAKFFFNLSSKCRLCVLVELAGTPRQGPNVIVLGSVKENRIISSKDPSNS